MFDLIHNKVNSNYFIVNIKLDFLEYNLFQSIETTIHIKQKYIIIIKKWIQNILDSHSKNSNWIIYIQNLNFNTVRIFIYLNSLYYSTMDDDNLIYITDMINYENIFKINIHDFSNLFTIHKLNLLIDLEFEIIKPSLDFDNGSYSSSNSYSTSSENSSISSSNNSYEIDTYDLIDDDYIDYFKNSEHIIKEKIYLNKITNDRNKIIKKIGISGINKVTFFNELNKLNFIKVDNSENSLYFNVDHNIYDSYGYAKIKENKIYYWVKINNNSEISTLLDHMYILFNKFSH